MKHVEITLHVMCPDDVPPPVIEWMADNLLQHACSEFGDDYQGESFGLDYHRAPLLGARASCASVLPRKVMTPGQAEPDDVSDREHPF